MLSRIPLLSSQAQYFDWAMQVEATAMLGGYYDPLIGQNTTTSTDASDVDKINQREQKAKGLIFMTVSQPIRRELQELKTTRTVVTEATSSEAATTEMVDVPADAVVCGSTS